MSFVVVLDIVLYICVHSGNILMMQRLKRDIERHLPELDYLCKIYRELARNGRNDTAGELRQKVDDVCKRWEFAAKCIQKTAKKIDRDRTISIDLDDSLESLTVWLNDVYMRLTHLQHSAEDIDIRSKLSSAQVCNSLFLMFVSSILFVCNLCMYVVCSCVCVCVCACSRTCACVCVCTNIILLSSLLFFHFCLKLKLIIMYNAVHDSVKFSQLLCIV